MSRVGRMNGPLSRQLDASVENANFIGPRAALPNASTYLQLEMLRQFLLITMQIGVGPESSQVAAVNDDAHVSGLMVKHSVGKLRW